MPDQRVDKGNTDLWSPNRFRLDIIVVPFIQRLHFGSQNSVFTFTMCKENTHQRDSPRDTKPEM